LAQSIVNFAPVEVNAWNQGHETTVNPKIFMCLLFFIITKVNGRNTKLKLLLHNLQKPIGKFNGHEYFGISPSPKFNAMNILGFIITGLLLGLATVQIGTKLVKITTKLPKNVLCG
jgi:hypothetical protein